MRGVLGASYAARGEYAEALTQFQQGAAVFGRISYFLAAWVRQKPRLGHRDAAHALLAELEAQEQAGNGAAAHLALLYAALGERDKAIGALTRACGRHDGDVMFIGVEPLLDPLRTDPRFGELMRTARLAR